MSHTIIQAEVDEFEKEFGNLTLGILSGDKNSPVFINNELEVPRLKSFLSAALQRAIERAGREMVGEEKVEVTEKDFDGDTEKMAIVRSENGGYNECRSLALSKLDTIINFKE